MRQKRRKAEISSRKGQQDGTWKDVFGEMRCFKGGRHYGSFQIREGKIRQNARHGQ